MTGADADNWLARSRQTLAQLELSPRAELVGRVVQIGDGVARITGLPQVGLNELLRFGHGRLGFALSLDVDSISAVMLDHATDIEAGHTVSGTGEVVRVPVGEALLGRVVDPLGRPLDQGGPIAAASHHPVERPAPAIIDRDLVNDPLMTGVLVVDTLFALGRGQRELIIGDRATGKTSLAVDTIINQKDTDMVCVYVAVGQRASAVERVIDAVRRHGDPGHCVFVVAGAADPPGLQWLAPFAAFTIAEYFRDRGGHALVVIDDLTKHAATHRELSLLTREPPGREAYPGDIFYLHARLLERAARLSPALGDGTLTALPIAEIEAGNLSAYIPTNLISITDGQLVLDARLFAANQRPAVDVGLSVSRVGGKTQKPALNDVAARLRLEYSQFLELEMFTRFGSVSDTRIKARITRGERTRALLAQPRFAGLGLLQQVALLAALDEGVFDEVPTAALHRLRSLLPNLTGLADLQQQIERGERLDDAGRSRLVTAVSGLLAAATLAPQAGANG